MFTLRSSARRASAAVRSRTAARALTTSSRQTLSSRVVGGLTVCGGAAAAALALHQHNQATASCAPGDVSGPATSAAPAPQSQPADILLESIPFYKPTRSQTRVTDALPEGVASVAKASYDDLSKIFDVTAKEGESTLAYAVLWGEPPPENTLPALPLMFSEKESEPFRRHMELLVRHIQNKICNDLLEVENFAADKTLGTPEGPATLSSLDGQPIGPEAREHLLWQQDAPGRMRENIVIRPGGTGGGIERVLQGGRVFAKAGVNVSVSNVAIPCARLRTLADDHPSLAPYKDLDQKEPVPLWTASISLVLHPISPHVPTVHANYRYFELLLPAEVNGKPVAGTGIPVVSSSTDGSAPSAPRTVRHWWFGGGSDLTPTYVVDEDATHFHSVLKRSLSGDVGGEHYPTWKSWCDKYFRTTHRMESRGIGGVFFDDQHTHPEGRDHYERVVRSLGESFSSSYFPIVLRRMAQPFDRDELNFQQLRRGRYAEFNFVYDRGTSYGMKMANARPEAILMSLPPIARFAYRQNWGVDERTKYTKEVLTTPKEW